MLDTFSIARLPTDTYQAIAVPADAATCPDSLKNIVGDGSVEWLSEDKGCLQSNENRLGWHFEVWKDGKKTKTGHGSWGCFCDNGNPSQKLRAGMYLSSYSAPLYEMCSSDGDCYGCAPTCGDRGDGMKVCGGGEGMEQVASDCSEGDGSSVATGLFIFCADVYVCCNTHQWVLLLSSLRRTGWCC